MCLSAKKTKTENRRTIVTNSAKTKKTLVEEVTIDGGK